ncbi:MAG: DNA-binding protein [Alistipes sp.]|nr:DNA-binding protein [Alistipes sp.]
MARETTNKSFVLRVDAATMEALEQWADDEFRSINGQLQWIIADALRRAGRQPKQRKEDDAQRVLDKANPQ